MRAVAAAVLCWVVAGVGAMPVAADTKATPGSRPTVDQLVTIFDRVVFGSEFAGVKASTRIKKWRQPLRVVVREFGEKVTLLADGAQERELRERRVKRLHFDFVQKHLNTLAELTGLKTEDAAATGKPANFVINFVPRLQMSNPKLAKIDRGLQKRLAAQGGCYFLVWTDEKSGNSLQKAVIVVNASRLMNRKDHCVLEEMTQSLGLPNDIEHPWPSIFANRGFGRELSRADRIIVRTLYDRRLPAGTPRAEALVLAREIIGELDAKLP